MFYLLMQDEQIKTKLPDNHIGKKTWKKLSYRQKQAIIKDRKNARKTVNAFIKDRLHK